MRDLDNVYDDELHLYGAIYLFQKTFKGASSSNKRGVFFKIGHGPRGVSMGLKHVHFGPFSRKRVMFQDSSHYDVRACIRV